MLPGVEQCFHAFRRVFDDIEDESEIHHVGGLFLNLRCVDRIPAGRRVSKFFNRENIATVAAAVVEEGFPASELAEFQQGFHRFGNLAADEGGLVAVDFPVRLSLGCGSPLPCFNKAMAFETKAFYSKGALPVQSEADARRVFQQTGCFFLAGELGELAVQRMLGGKNVSLR